MSTVASAASAAPSRETARRPRRAKPPVARRAGIQLLLGVLIVGAIPVASTVRILENNALRNERAHADSALRAQLQSGLSELNRLADETSTRAADLAASADVQRAFMADRPAALERIAAGQPGVSFFFPHKQRLGAAPAKNVLERSVWLTVNGRRIGKVVAVRPLDQRLSASLTRDAPHARGDRLVLVRQGRLIGTRLSLATHNRTVRLEGDRYRSLASLIPDAGGIRLLALRPEHAIEASVAPYRHRIRYAAIGSFALLVLVALMFAGPLLRMLGDFRRVASQATTDSLTGIANRRSFDEELALEWRRAHRIGDSFALVLLDLDDFKKVNDTHGHPAGDAVLRTIGEVLGSGVRQIDLAARYGGEEFVVLVPESDLKGATQLAKRLRLAVSKARTELPDGRLLKVTASFGVAAKGDLQSAEQLVAAADEVLYEAKRAGKNRVVAAGEVEKPAAPKKKAPARIKKDASLGESGLRTAGGRGARSSGERRAPKGRPNRPGSKDPA
ncbi:MAG: GGDEF domain-containing protein [Actinomycetota bacterium]|nr:GGDEF domain-containing protein [Actinomycetota bacterium]